MVELTGKKRKQPSSRPQGWLPNAIVVQLELTARQQRYAKRSAGIARFVYNRLVANAQASRDAGLWLTPHELEKELNAAKKVRKVKNMDPPLGFITTVSKFVAQGACRNYGNSYSRWRNKNLKAGKPVFHKKLRTGAGSFLAASGVAVIKYDGHRRIRLPYLGSVRMTRNLPEGAPYEVTLRKQNGRWYAGIAYWEPPTTPSQRETQSVGGVDVGINPLAVDSGGDHPNPEAHYQPVQAGNGQWQYPNPKAYDRALRTLRRWQRAQARRTPGSRGWWEAQRRIDRAHRRSRGLRDNAHHHVSRTLVQKYHTIGIETLNVSGMIKAGLQSKALADAGMSGLLDKIRYKAGRCGAAVVEAGQWYPSSKTCSVCGVVNGDLGREPEWDCPNCGAHHDRNENAARNLRKLALLAVGEDVMLPDGEALADGDAVIGETGPDEGRTKQAMTVAPPAQAGPVTIVIHLEYPFPHLQAGLELSHRPVVGESGVPGVLQEEGFLLRRGLERHPVGLLQDLAAPEAASGTVSARVDRSSRCFLLRLPYNRAEKTVIISSTSWASSSSKVDCSPWLMTTTSIPRSSHRVANCSSYSI